MTIRRIGLAALLAVASPAGWASAQQLELPDPVGWVNDFAGVLSPETEERLEAVILEVRAKSGGEIVVVTLPSLQGRTRDEVALELGRRWGVGAAGDPGDTGRNLGTVILVVPKETSPDGQGHLKIEVGDNTARFLSAGEAGRIRDRFMIPAFVEADYDTGILAGAVAIAAVYADELGFELTGEAGELARRQPAEDGGGGGGSALIFAVVLFLIVWRLVRASGRGPRGPFGGGGGGRRYRGPIIIPWGGGGRGGGGGGFGGGFGGFGGGGGFSGGGAGGSW